MASILGKPGGPGQFPTHDLSTVRGALQTEGGNCPHFPPPTKPGRPVEASPWVVEVSTMHGAVLGQTAPQGGDTVSSLIFLFSFGLYIHPPPMGSMNAQG